MRLQEEWETFLAGLNFGKSELNLSKNQAVFSQGEAADELFYIREGRVKITVVSMSGKEATLSILGPTDLLGVCCLSERARERLGTATALEPSRLVRIKKETLLKCLRDRPQLVESLLDSILTRTLRLEKDLCTQILDSSEKRLARTLLNLVAPSEEDQPECIKMPRISHDMLATMVGTTRSRITYFMNKFKSQGCIDYGKGMMVRPHLLSMMIQED
jgi:CRP/FNR family transcriptional regulator, cyclic AMP receptor protein